MTTSIQQASKYPLRFGTRVTNALNTCLAFNLLDDAIADIFCLKTYTHGTSPKCYNSIMNKGADPSYGGKGGESSFYNAFKIDRSEAIKDEGEDSGWRCENRFFVFLHECPPLIKRWQPRVYCIAACIGENCSPEHNKIKKIVLVVLSFFEGVFSPTLKFHLKPDSPITFKKDETFHATKPIAGYTSDCISSDHIGLLGCFKQGMDRQWGNRIKSNKKQFSLGLLKLSSAVIVAIIGLFPPILLTYGVIKTVQVLGRVFLPLRYNKN